uniref:Uncharacterized protein n=1 Tax=Mycena chlorophos TaxID=658473 RepID=A0ABQ0L2P2_MYCCL|nr:predicted protein [Mycena chlorophos]
MSPSRVVRADPAPELERVSHAAMLRVEEVALELDEVRLNEDLDGRARVCLLRDQARLAKKRLIERYGLALVLRRPLAYKGQTSSAAPKPLPSRR